MGYHLNKIILIGNVGKPPVEHKFADDKKRLVKSTLATSESWKDKKSGEWIEETCWHNVVCFNDFLCGVALNHVEVGKLVYIEGQSKTRKYEKDGVDHYINEIVLPKFGGDIKVLPKNTTPGDNGDPITADPDDDIPF